MTSYLTDHLVSYAMPEGHTVDPELRLLDWTYDGHKDVDRLKGEQLIEIKYLS